MSTTDPLAALNTEVAQIQTDLTSLQKSNAAVLTYLQQLLAGAPASGTVNVNVAELATTVTNLSALDTALQAVNAANVAAEPPAAPGS